VFPIISSPFCSFPPRERKYAIAAPTWQQGGYLYLRRVVVQLPFI
jgi:hypothetical protein